MIFDFQDISTKIYIAHMTRKWVQTDNNSLILLGNPQVKEITEADLSFNSEDDLVWTTLYLIGVGLLRYFVKDQGKRFGIALSPKWKKPYWLNRKSSQRNMRNHIDLLMEAERGSGEQLTALWPSLDVINRAKTRLLPPREPNRDPLVDVALIRKNRKDHAIKVAFHRGGK